MGRAADLRRIESLAGLEHDETVLACSRAWLSSPTRLKALTANRVRAVVTITDRRLVVCSVAFWTRRAKRRAVVERLDALKVIDLDELRGDRLEVTRGDAAWILHFGSNAASTVKTLRYGVLMAKRGVPLLDGGFPVDGLLFDDSSTDLPGEP